MTKSTIQARRHPSGRPVRRQASQPRTGPTSGPNHNEWVKLRW